MISTAAIVGAGALGGATAQALATGEAFRRIVLVDQAGSIARGKALDLLQASAIAGTHTRIEGTDDPARMLGCAVCVVADAAVSQGTGERTDPLAFAGEAPVIWAGAQAAGDLESTARTRQIAPARLLGSAPEAFSSAARAIVAVEAACSPAEVTLAAVGAPDNLTIAWSGASIGGYPLERLLTAAQRVRIEARVARLWPPGPYALGAAAARVAEAVVLASRRTFSILTILDGEFGTRNRAGALPVRLSPLGIAERRVPPLDPRERVAVETTLAASRPR